LGKTEDGAIWLDGSMTSPYKFYQFWHNVSDEDASKYIRFFSLLSKEEIESVEQQHLQAPNQHALQQALAKDITVRVHSAKDYEAALRASKILFGQTTEDELRALSNLDFEKIFEGVPTKKMSKTFFDGGADMMKLLVDETKFFPSKGEARRTIQSKGVAVNKQTISLDHIVKQDQLINNRYLLLQKGKREYFLVIAE
jgi:tyrosyl-tRNA synthetase